jgi:uncharacterized membrane protein YgdD (TMEM256/DUF423 family)
LKNYFLTVAGIFGATGVALGALGAHFLKAKMQAGIITPEQLAGFDTAAKYQLFHSIALLVLFFSAKDSNSKWLTIGANLFIIGIILFSGSLYILTTRALTGLESFTFLGPITPLGGVALIGGWVCLVVQSFKLKKIK